MRAYKLPNGTWIDLEAIQSIGPFYANESNTVCEAQFAFQDEPQDLDVGSGKNPRHYVRNCDWNTEKLRAEYDARARKAYDKLIAAWRGKA